MFSLFLDRLLPALLSAPSVWGKLPAHGDFTYQGAQSADMAVWQQWFLQYPLSELLEHCPPQINAIAPQRAGWLHLDPVSVKPPVNTRPWCFAFPAGTLPEAPHIPAKNLIIGVMSESCDKVGRQHPIVIWHTLRSDGVAHLKDPFNWLYWLARLLHDHTPPRATPDRHHKEIDFLSQLDELWECAEHLLTARLRLFRKPLYRPDLEEVIQKSRPLPCTRASGDPESPAGVHQLPWDNWPQLLLPENTVHRSGYFWQQSDNGEYIKLSTLPLRWDNGALV